MLRKVYVRYREDQPESENFFSALHGFRQRGVETAPFYGFGDVPGLGLGPDVGIAGYIGDVWDALDAIGAPRPDPVDYPDELVPFLGRKVWLSDLGAARGMTSSGLFCKPVKQKLFTGLVFTGRFDDQMRIGSHGDDEQVWLSEPVDFVSEYRCFVLRGDVLDARRYKGDWSRAPDRAVVMAAVAAFLSAPAAYVLDFGVTRDGRTLLVEANDGFSMGAYGLEPTLYAQMLEARWEEMTFGVGSGQ